MSKEIHFTTEAMVVDKPGKYSSEFRVIADVDEQELLDQFDEATVLKHMDKDAFLDEIGEDYAREHFGIEAE